ncbi:asparagine synthase-related protein [Nocardia vinacea]|uniref:asparagine synthase-related protein n=1 Tax=Nocardia vinacea TaxID=96468 RepID=UPI002E0D7679|nr:asparagine synthase-related protein [Nocardia vinacea]
MTGDARTGFVVLPDSEAGVGIARRLLPWGKILAEHPSERPMVVGDCRDRPVIYKVGHAARVVILGHALIDEDAVHEYAISIDSAARWRALLDTIDGSFHSIVNVNGDIYVNGSTYGSRSLYRARVDGIDIAADTVHALTHLVGGRLDVGALAAHLLEPIPHHLAQRPLLAGIDPVPPGVEMVLTPRGTSRSIRGKTETTVVRDLDEGAHEVRNRLVGAVSARTAAGGTVTSELSGGYDSTSISFIAARGPAEVKLLTARGRDSANEDLEWALRAARHLPEVEHTILPDSDLPLTYSGLEDGPTWLNEPSPLIVGRSRVGALAKLASTFGSSVHLTGHGGDHVFTGLPTRYRDLLWQRPFTAWRGLRGFAALGGWRLRDLLYDAVEPTGFHSWWKKNTRPVVGVPERRKPMLGWAITPSMPIWATETAEKAISEGILWMASTREPLAPERGYHVELETIIEGARTVAVLNRMSLAAGGPPLAAPYFDDRVISASLSVAVQHRVSAWTYKPLLRASVRGIVPDVVLQRQTKDDGSHDVELGLRKHRDELVALWEGSRLGDIGLIDSQKLKQLCANPSSFELEEGTMYTTIACELWLRDLERSFVEPQNGSTGKR